MTGWDEDTAVTNLAGQSSAKKVRACLIVMSGGTVGSMIRLAEGDTVIGRGATATIRLEDDGLSRSHSRLRIKDGKCWLEDLGSRNGTYCNGKQVTAPIVLSDGDKVQIGRATILKFTYQDQLDEEFHEQMIESALRDGLTKTFNKRYFAERLDSEIKFASRHSTALTLLMIDLDHFKQINDMYGHVAGDQVLTAIGACLLKGVRNEDVVARYGGEEFTVLARAIALAEARVFAERLRRTVEAMTIHADDQTIQVTISIGLAAYPESGVETAHALVDAADMALYRAKRGGRNRVAV